MSTPPSVPEPSYGPADPWAPPSSSAALPSYPASSGSTEPGGDLRQAWAHEAASQYPVEAPTGRRRKSTGGAWRIVLGLVLVLSILASVAGSTTSSSPDTSGDPVATLTVVVLRLLMLGLAIGLLISGARRNSEKRRLRRSV